MLTTEQLLRLLEPLGDNAVTLPMLVRQVQSPLGLVPFVGAGLSVPFKFPQWREFLEELAPDEARKQALRARLAAGEYEEAAQDLMDWRGPDAFQDAVDHAFGPTRLEGKDLQGAVSLLPRLAQGPVLTTNFDSVLERVFTGAGKPFERVILGMKTDFIRDAFHRNLRYLIKLHGDAADRTDRVLTRREYEARYGTAEPLRPVLEFAMRHPLLFLGCSLQRDRTVRVLESLHQGLDIVQYAVLERPAEDAVFAQRQRFLSERGIRVVWFPTQRHDLIEDLLTYLADQARRSSTKRAAPFMAPPKPEWFVERPREFEHLLARLLDPERAAPVGITTALQGAGGYGKTTLAAALCHEERVIKAFDDGILWVTLGQTPNLVGELTKLYEALTGERPGFVDKDQGAIKVGEALEDRHCLLVIDDVWRRSDLEPFLRGGRGCARLITTRRFDVAGEVSWIKVDEMGTNEAVTLLTKRLPSPPGDLTPFRALARRLGKWPLLLKLAGGTLRAKIGRGEALSGAVEYLDRAFEKRGVTAFDPKDATQRDEAVGVSVAATLDLLDKSDRQRLSELAVFPEDQEIPLTTLRQLWGLDDLDTEDCAQRLSDLSLFDLDLRQGSMGLHDVLRAFLAKELGDQAVVHQRLLAAWGDPHKLPDAYAWRWVAYHLAQGGQTPRLRELLLDFDWLQAKLNATDCVALLADFDHVQDNEDLSLIQGAIRLSAHAIGPDKNQLVSQLVGRLSGETTTQIKQLVASACAWRGAPWMRPLNGNLHPPGTALLRTLRGHADAVTAVALSADGRRAVSGSTDGTLKVWNLESGREPRTLQGHGPKISTVALSADGSVAVSGASDDTLKVWDVENGRELRTLKGHAKRVNAAALSADGRVAVSASSDTTLKVWDVTTGQELRTLRGHAGSVSAATMSADGRVALSASRDTTVKVWDVASGRELRTLKGHDQLVSAVAISADGRLAVSGSQDATVKLWDVESGRKRRTLDFHAGSGGLVALSADGRWAVSGSLNQTLKVWDLDRPGRAPRILQSHAGEVNTVALSADGRRAVSGSDDRTLKVWNVKSGRELGPLKGHGGVVRSVALSADGRQAVSGAWANPLKTWDVVSGRDLQTLEAYEHWALSVALSADGRRALSGSTDETLRLWDLQSGRELATFRGHGGAVYAVALSTDGRQAISGSTDRTLKVWNVEKGQLLRTLQGHADAVRSLALRADGRQAVSGSQDRTLKVWDVDSGRELRTLEGHTGWVMALALTADGRRAVSGSTDQTLKLWDVHSGRELRTLHGHAAEVMGVAISANGLRAVSAARDQTLKAWDVESEKCLATFTGESAMYCCDATRDGRIIVAGEASGRVHFLRLVLPDDPVTPTEPWPC